MAHYYKFEIDGQTWTSEDYTLTEMVAVETRTQIRWWLSDFATEAGNALAAIETWYARDMSADDAAKKAGALTSRQIRITRVDGDDLPNQFANGVAVVEPGKADG